MADPKQLTEVEARVLLGTAQLPDPQVSGAWVLRDKRVQGMTLGAPVLADLLWVDVDFHDIHWRSGSLQRAQLQNTHFTGATFSRCSFEDVLFIGCNFAGLQTADVQFRRCRFEACAFSELVANTTDFDDCTFEGTRITDADLRQALLQSCVLQRCELAFVRAARSLLLGCSFGQGSLRNARFSYVDTQDLRFDGIALEQVLFVGGKHARWQLVAATGSGFKLNSAVLRELAVSKCDGLAELGLISSSVHQLQIIDSPALIGFTIFRSEVTGFRVANSSLVGASFDEARIGPTSTLESVAFHGLRITDSQLTGPHFVRCGFHDYLYLHRSVLHALATDASSYEPGLRELQEDVTYPSSTARLGAAP